MTEADALCFPDIFGPDAKVSLVQVQPGAESRTFVSTGEAPGFLIERPIPAGVVHFRLKLTSPLARGRGSLCFDSGGGFLDSEKILLPELRRELEVDTLLRLEKPVRALRFEPLDKPGEFRIEYFSMDSVPGAKLYVRAVQSKIKEIRAGMKTGRAIKKGISLLLKGDFKSFKGKLVQSLGSGVNTREPDYHIWRENNQMTDARRARMREELKGFQDPPLISIIMPVYNPPEKYLRMAIDSVLKQIYPHWELCIADDCSTKPFVRDLLEEYKARDPRIKVVYRPKNGHISAASNSALELASGNYYALMDNDDEIPEHALFKVAKEIMADPSVDMLYSDEDKIDLNGVHNDPFFKPDWSPEYFLSCMYTCHLGVYRASLVKEVGGFRSKYDTSQDYDLVLRIVAKTSRIRHISDILYHWRMLPSSAASGVSAKPNAYRVAQRALESHLQQTGREGTVEPGPGLGYHRVRFKIVGDPKVSIVISSVCRRAKVRGEETWSVLKCVECLRQKSTYKNYEILVVDDNDMPQELERALKPYNIRRIPYTPKFNLASKMNLGASKAEGSQLVFVNDGIEIVTPDWMEAMLEFSQLNGVGAVGLRLSFPDGRLQHCGVTILKGTPCHPFYGCVNNETDYFFSTAVHRNCSAVTGACMMTRADVFKSVGGFSAQFPMNYSDVDYCLKIAEAGKRTVYTPYAEHFHHESVKPGGSPEELQSFKDRWLKKLPRDPYYNDNLSMVQSDYRIDTDYVA